MSIIEIDDNVVFVDNNYAGDITPTARPCTVHVWAVPTDYRTSGYFISLRHPGHPMEVPACRQASTTYIGEAAVEPDPGLVLARVKTEKLAEITEKADAALGDMTATFSGHEKLSWPKQEAEALAYDADPQAATPLLAAIATARGITVDALVAKVLANVAAYEVASGTILGMQQDYEDQVAAAETVQDVQAIVPDFGML
jgi:hypothetical protein